MYSIDHIKKKGLDFIELKDSHGCSKAEICLSQGGRLDTLIFNRKSILADFEITSYKDNYQSAILFPFANRIKDGHYSFNGDSYQLPCNEKDKNNALHGLVYDKCFECVQSELKSDIAKIVLRYTEPQRQLGFPFRYSLELIYKLKKDFFSLEVCVKNEDKSEFPFTVGWHPYFKSSNLNISALDFISEKKITCDEQQIPNGSMNIDLQMPFELGETKLDDCYPLMSNKINFFTPEYQLKLTSSSKENFLQLYTPEMSNVIAIEPMTGAPNNFNNGLGLQFLKPKESYRVEWSLTLESTLISKLTNTLNTKLCNS